MITLEILFTVRDDATKRTLSVQIGEPELDMGSTWKCPVSSSPVTLGHTSPIDILGEGSWDAAKYAIGFVYNNLKALEAHSGYVFYWPDGEQFDLTWLIFRPETR